MEAGWIKITFAKTPGMTGLFRCVSFVVRATSSGYCDREILTGIFVPFYEFFSGYLDLNCALLVSFGLVTFKGIE